MTASLLLHVGYHKTATTWAQKKLFQPEHGFRQIAFHQDAFDYVVKPHGFNFSPDLLRDLINRNREKLVPGEVAVLSSEILSGHPFQGGHQSDVYAERLKRIVPTAKILISIRNQLSILPSVYAQYVLRGGTMSHSRFFDFKPELGYFHFTPEHFEYDRLVSHYQSLFGRDNVYVLTQESLIQDIDAASRALAKFSGAQRFAGLSETARARTAVSYPEYALPVLRRINHVQASTLQPRPIVALGRTPKGLFKLVGYAAKRPPFSSVLKNWRPVSDYVKIRFKGRYTEANIRLADLGLPGLDLSDYD